MGLGIFYLSALDCKPGNATARELIQVNRISINLHPYRRRVAQNNLVRHLTWQFFRFPFLIFPNQNDLVVDVSYLYPTGFNKLKHRPFACWS